MKVGGHIKRSTTSNEKLLAYQANNTAGKTQLKLIQDVSTRWNSTFYMLQRFTVLEQTFKATVALIDKDVSQFSSEEWKRAHTLVKLLKPFETVTKHVSGEKYATASLVIPLTLGLQDVYVKAFVEKLPAALKTVAMLLSSGVAERFGIYEKSNTLLVTTFLDPRYKNCVLSSDQINEDVKIKLIVLVANKIEELSSGAPTYRNRWGGSRQLRGGVGASSRGVDRKLGC